MFPKSKVHNRNTLVEKKCEQVCIWNNITSSNTYKLHNKHSLIEVYDSKSAVVFSCEAIIPWAFKMWTRPACLLQVESCQIHIKMPAKDRESEKEERKKEKDKFLDITGGNQLPCANYISYRAAHRNV